MRVGEIVLFGALAGGVHLGAFALWSPQIAGGAEGGADGAASITLQAAPAQLAAMAEAWQTPPKADTPKMAAPRAPTASPAPRLAAQTTPPPPPSAPPVRPEPAPATSDNVQILQPGPGVVPQSPRGPSGAVPERLAVTAPDAPSPQTAFERAAPSALPAPVLPQTVQIDTSTPKPSEAAPQASMRPAVRPTSNPQTRAAGTGDTARAGTGQTAQDRAPNGDAEAQTRRLEAAWGASIQAAVQRNARNPGVGPATVRVQLQVAPSGTLVGLGVARSSGIAAADGAALNAVKRARRFAAAPDALDKPAYNFQVTLRFQ